MNFDKAFDRLMGNEGGYTDGKGDPGGETKWGISKRAYPGLDIADLPRDHAKVIYERDFWKRGQMDQYDGAISFQVFDAAVNHGIETAVRMLQRAAGVADDGHIGPVTVAAITSQPVSRILALFIAERLWYWTGLSNWPQAGKGWARRAVTDIRYAVQDYEGETKP